MVLRRPPRPPYPPSAHDVVREARILEALHPAHLPVPRVLAICEDPEVLDAPFYVMEYVPGYVLSTSMPAQLDRAAARRAIGPTLIDALAELHAVEPARHGLESIGRPDGYLERQLRRFGSIWDETATRAVPDVDRVARWLADNIPRSGPASVVHGDFRLGNVILRIGQPVELAAVLDWEMATLGDPLADLGYLLASWPDPGDSHTPIRALSAVTRGNGFMRRDALLRRYEARTGRDLAAIGWYVTFALWKAAVFLEASYSRYRAGTSSDPYFAGLEHGVPQLGRAAAERVPV